MQENKIPRRLKRFHRERKKAFPADSYDSGLEKIASEETLSKDLYEKKKSEEKEMLSDIETGIKRIEEEEVSESLLRADKDRRQRAKELTAGAVRRFRQENNRLPMRQEYEQIVESIFSQLQEEEKKEKQKTETKKQKEREKKEAEKQKQREEQKKRREERKKKKYGEEEEQQLPPEETKPLVSLEDLDVKEMLSKQSLEDESDNLEDLVGTEEDAGEELELKEIPAEKENNCPNCNKKTEKKFFCPKCGNPFCSDCAKSVKQVGKQTEYECPKCGNKMKK